MGEVWEFEGKQYSYESYYHLDQDAWVHEIASENNSGFLMIVVPDATPDDGPFTPRRDEAVLRFTEGELPVSIVERLIHTARAAGDIG